MSEVTLHFDTRANQSMTELMDHYQLSSKAEVISKALAILRIAAHVDKTQGELLARKGKHETKIVLR